MTKVWVLLEREPHRLEDRLLVVDDEYALAFGVGHFYGQAPAWAHQASLRRVFRVAASARSLRR